jgi:hypothetical protein
MKKLLLIIGIAMNINVSAQYSKSYAPPKGWASPELYLPTTTLITTFGYLTQHGEQMTETQRQIFAATGMATSVITHFVFRKIRESRKSNKQLLTLKH